MEGRDWPIDGLEFSDAEGTYRFKLSQTVPGGPTLLLRARAMAEKAVFVNTNFKPKKGIAVLSLLALHAETSSDGVDKVWIYEVVWGNKELDWQVRKSAYSPDVNSLEQVIPKLRALLGAEAIETLTGTYRLTVPVRRVHTKIPEQQLKERIGDGASTPEPARFLPPPDPSLEVPATPAEIQAEMRAEARIGLAKRGPASPSISTLGAKLRIGLSITGSFLLVWTLFRSPTVFRNQIWRYTWVSFLITGGAVLFAAAVAKCYRLLKRQSGAKDKLVVYIAPLGTDQFSEDTRGLVSESIRSAFGTNGVDIRFAKIRPGLTEGDEESGYQTARQFLKRKNGDVIIWGKAYAPPQMKPRVALRFTTQTEYYRPLGTFGLMDDCLLDTTFGPELGSMVAAVAASMAFPSMRDSGAFHSEVLRPAATVLARISDDLDHLYAVDRGCFLHALGQIYLVIGDESGDAAALRMAESALREAASLVLNGRAPRVWLLVQNSLGNALLVLGEREAGTDRLKEAVLTFQSALDACRNDRLKAYRCTIQNNLGLAWRLLGERENDPDKLKLSIEAFHAASAPEQSGPLRRAMVLNNLGMSTTRLGQRERERNRLDEAVEMLKGVVEMFERDAQPLLWSMVQNNLGVALTALSERDTQPQLLEEAAEAFRNAADVRTLATMPLKWASIQVNLGTTLIRLGDNAHDTSRFQEAITATRAALELPIREHDPFLWASAQNTLSFALMKLGDHQDNIELLVEAERTCQSALEEWLRDRVPAPWAMATSNRACILMLVAQREASSPLLQESIRLFRDAADVFTREHDPVSWAVNQNGLGLALLSLGDNESLRPVLEEAATVFRAVLDEWPPERSRELSAGATIGLEHVLSLLDKFDRDNRQEASGSSLA